VVAASQTAFDNLSSAARGMIQPLKQINPEPAFVSKYEMNYQRFKLLLAEKGYT
jgi:hypothetical protein